MLNTDDETNIVLKLLGSRRNQPMRSTPFSVLFTMLLKVIAAFLAITFVGQFLFPEPVFKVNAGIVIFLSVTTFLYIAEKVAFIWVFAPALMLCIGLASHLDVNGVVILLIFCVLVYAYAYYEEQRTK